MVMNIYYILYIYIYMRMQITCDFFAYYNTQTDSGARMPVTCVLFSTNVVRVRVKGIALLISLKNVEIVKKRF